MQPARKSLLNVGADSEVIEDALRHQLGLELLRRLWDSSALDDEAMTLAVEAQHKTRSRR